MWRPTAHIFIYLYYYKFFYHVSFVSKEDNEDLCIRPVAPIYITNSTAIFNEALIYIALELQSHRQ